MAHQILTHHAGQFPPPGKPALRFALRIHNLAMNQPFPPVDPQAQDHRDVALVGEYIYLGCCGLGQVQFRNASTGSIRAARKAG